MKKILLIKMTSMGDLIQMLPALTDASRAISGFQIDWLADTSFQEIPRLHPAVRKVFPVPYRHWKKNMRQALQGREITQFFKELRTERYDMVIDAQSNIKSAVFGMGAKGVRYGLDKTSVREYGAHWTYHHTITISRLQNHAQRMRQLMAAFLGYELPMTSVDYGIRREQLPPLDFQLPESFVFIVPIASCANKLWPEPFWHEVIQSLRASGYDLVMPWWSQEEHDRVLRLKGTDARIHILPSLNLTQKARVLSQAQAAISLDTGLAHMAAALNVPNVTLYGPSDPSSCGTVGDKQVHVTANEPPCAPCLRNKCTYQGNTLLKPACLESILPNQVLQAFYDLLSPRLQ